MKTRKALVGLRRDMRKSIGVTGGYAGLFPGFRCLVKVNFPGFLFNFFFAMTELGIDGGIADGRVMRNFLGVTAGYAGFLRFICFFAGFIGVYLAQFWFFLLRFFTITDFGYAGSVAGGGTKARYHHHRGGASHN